jgi:hypothetical protein
MRHQNTFLCNLGQKGEQNLTETWSQHQLMIALDVAMIDI